MNYPASSSGTEAPNFVSAGFRPYTQLTPPSENLIHHSDRGSQYLSIKYTERLADAGLEPSVGTVGDSYDNALAETMIGLFKAEVIVSIQGTPSILA